MFLSCVILQLDAVLFAFVSLGLVCFSLYIFETFKDLKNLYFYTMLASTRQAFSRVMGYTKDLGVFFFLEGVS